MAQNFLTCDREQTFLMPPSLREWLPEDHLAWSVLDAVEEMDLGAFYASYRPDGWGRAAHDPQMMVALLLYAYATGERSARRIERRCHEDVAVRVIAANHAPDHATIARFRCRHEDALGALFGEVLSLCARAGLVSMGLLALDSTKIAANASGSVNRSYEQIAREILAEAGAVDAREDELYGAERGDELPPELRERSTRQARLRAAKHELERERDERLAKGARAPSSRVARLSEAKRRLEAEHAAELRALNAHEAWRAERTEEQAARGQKMTGKPPKPVEAPASPRGRVNTTDPDSGPVKTRRGFIQGYNAQAVATPGQIIVAAEIPINPADGGKLCPMVAAARSELEQAGVSEAPEVVLADAGYWGQSEIERLEGEGIEALVPPDGAARRSPPSKRKRAGTYAKMRTALASERGRGLYRRRQQIIEPVFAQTKVTRGADRFQRRGLAACRAEWRLIAATHNLLKLHRHGLITAPA